MHETKVRRILVPVEGAPSDEASLALASSIAKRDRSEVLALYVIEIRRSLPLDAQLEPELEQGEQVLENVQKTADHLGMRINPDLLQARDAGPAIVSEAVERDVDLIVMGVPYKERFGEFCVESRANYVLTHAPCRVLLTRDPLKGTGAA